MIRIKILFIVLLALIGYSTEAQNMFGSVGAPDGKELRDAGAGLVHVDLYTGTGSVNVPIYDYSLDGLDLGVSFTYNAKGIKVDEIASSIGLGWSLRAGGSITRQKKGIEDEVTMPAKYTVPVNDPDDYLEGCIVPGANFNTYYNGGKVDDQEHDIFHINLCGRSLKLQFYLDDQGDLHYITYPKSEIKLEYVIKDMVAPTGSDMTYGVSYNYYPLSADNPIIGGIGQTVYGKVLTFNIIDERGNKFYFERGDFEDKDYKLVNSLLDQTTAEGSYYPTNQWDLRKVETASGFTVLYDYKRVPINATFESVTEIIDGGEVYSALPDGNGDYYVVSDPLTLKENIWVGFKTHVSKITYPNGVIVSFELENNMQFDQNGDPYNISRCDCWGDFKLKSVKIESQSGTEHKNAFKYTLQHTYFNSNKYGITAADIVANTNCHPIGSTWSIPSYMLPSIAKSQHYRKGYRLKLNSIIRYGLDNTTHETYYEFEYNTEQLPYRGASQKDYFGYYNGNSTTPVVLENLRYRNGDHINYPQYDYHYFSIPKSVYYESGTHYPLDDAYGNLAANGTLGLSTDYGTDRSSDATKMQACLLKKIKNGMGGQLEIQYKGDYTLSNPQYQYWWWQPVTSGGGQTREYGIDGEIENVGNDGLVVEKIIETDIYSPDHKRTTVYSYSSGQRFNKGGYTWYPKHYPSNEKMFTNFFVGPLELYNGSNHGFSTVEKKYLGFNDEPLSKEIYEFTNLTLSAEPYTNMMKKTSTYHHTMPGELAVHRMGNLLKVSKFDFDNNNNTVTPAVTETTYEYDEVDETPDNGYSGNHKIGLRSMSHFQGPGNTSNPCGGAVWTSDGTVHESYYPIDYYLTRLKKETTKLFSKDANSITCSLVTVTNYAYDDLHNISSVTSTDSKGITFETWYSYNYDYPDWYAQLYNGNSDVLAHINELCNNNLQYLVSNDYWKLDGSDYYSIGFKCSAPYTFNNSSGVKNVRFPASFASKQSTKIHDANMFPISGGIEYPSSLVDRGAAVGFADNFTTTNFGTNMVLASYAKSYDNGQNPLEVWTNDRKNVISYIWDTKLSKKLAEVVNAIYDDIAYTSFERGDSYSSIYTPDQNKGNWDFDKNYIDYYTATTDQTVMTGKYALLVVSPTTVDPSEILSRLLTEKTFLLSFWCMEAGSNSNLPQVKVYNGSTLRLSPTLTVQNQVGNWKLYTAEIPAVQNDIIHIGATIGEAGYYMDEVRLHPTDAMMTSYTYEPLLGVSSSNDVSNYITYTDYDVHGNYFRTRDMRGKIVEQLTEAYDDYDDYDPNNPDPDDPPNN